MTDDGVYIERVRVGENIEVLVTVMARYLGLLPKWFVDMNEDSNKEEMNPVKDKVYKMENSKVPILIYLSDSKSVPQNHQSAQSQTKS